MGNADDTPTRLVAAAERLFVEGGEAATSLRAISRAAMSNAAAVHYHFGGRDQLLCAVLARHLAPLGPQRRQLLEPLRGTAATVATVLEAALRPDLELLARLRKRKVRLARFLGTAYAQSDGAVGALMQRQVEEFTGDVAPVLLPSLSGVDEPELRRRLWAVRATVAALFAAATAKDESGPLGAGGMEGQLRWLVGFLTPAVGAPTPARGSKRAR